MHNNYILFSFGMIFLALAVFSPIIRSEFEGASPEYDTGVLEDSAQADVSSSTAITFLSALFLWVFGAPFWLNIILTMMRLIFWVVVYDKLRGVGN